MPDEDKTITKEEFYELLEEYADFHEDVKNFCRGLSESLIKIGPTENTVEIFKSLNCFLKRCINRFKKQIERTEYHLGTKNE